MLGRAEKNVYTSCITCSRTLSISFSYSTGHSTRRISMTNRSHQCVGNASGKLEKWRGNAALATAAGRLAPRTHARGFEYRAPAAKDSRSSPALCSPSPRFLYIPANRIENSRGTLFTRKIIFASVYSSEAVNLDFHREMCIRIYSAYHTFSCSRSTLRLYRKSRSNCKDYLRHASITTTTPFSRGQSIKKFLNILSRSISVQSLLRRPARVEQTTFETTKSLRKVYKE